MPNCSLSYPWACPGVSLHQVSLELIHFVLSGGSHGGRVDLVHGVATQVGGQLNDDGSPPRAPLSHQHGVGGLVGWGYGPRQSTHLLYHRLQTTIMIHCKSHWYMSIFLFPFCPLFLCFIWLIIGHWSSYCFILFDLKVVFCFCFLFWFDWIFVFWMLRNEHLLIPRKKEC